MISSSNILSPQGSSYAAMLLRLRFPPPVLNTVCAMTKATPPPPSSALQISPLENDLIPPYLGFQKPKLYDTSVCACEVLIVSRRLRITPC